MSELKAAHAFDVYEAYTKTGDDDAAQVYLKSEADKVIAELKRQIEFLKTTTSSCKECTKCADGMGKVFNKELDPLKDRLRQHKYKRCLAMVEWCSYKSKCLDQYSRHTDYLPNIEKYRRKSNHYADRCNKLLLLAEKFKEAK